MSKFIQASLPSSVPAVTAENAIEPITEIKEIISAILNSAAEEKTKRAAFKWLANCLALNNISTVGMSAIMLTTKEKEAK